VPLDIQRHRVLIQKWEYMIINKLAIKEGAFKIANLLTIFKNKQLFY